MISEGKMARIAGGSGLSLNGDLRKVMNSQPSEAGLASPGRFSLEFLQLFLLKVAIKAPCDRDIGVCLGIDEGIVGSVPGPGAAGDTEEFDEAPVQLVAGFQGKIVANGGRDIDSGLVVLVGPGWLPSKDVFPVVGDPWTAVLPLGVADSAAEIELDPAALADAGSRSGIVAGKPGDDA